MATDAAVFGSAGKRKPRKASKARALRCLEPVPTRNAQGKEETLFRLRARDAAWVRMRGSWGYRGGPALAARVVSIAGKPAPGWIVGMPPAVAKRLRSELIGKQ